MLIGIDGGGTKTALVLAEKNGRLLNTVKGLGSNPADIGLEECENRLRSELDELLRGFGDFDYPNEIGPGVYDIHSPRVPSQDEMLRLLRKAATVIAPEKLWVNPDCGLKTRGWPETEAAL